MSVELKDLLGDEPHAEAYAQEMKDRPYTFDPLVLLLAGRAAELRAKVNELEGKTKNSENSKSELIKKVNRLGRTKSVVKGSGGTSSGGGKVSYTNRQIENMSLEDLEKLDSQLRLDN